MKILKFTFFLILRNVFFIAGLEAQDILLPEFEIKSEPLPSCTPKMPKFVINSFNAEIFKHDILNSKVYVRIHIKFNNTNFSNFDHYEIQTTYRNGNRYDTTIGTSAILIIHVPETGGEDELGLSSNSCYPLDLSFQVKAICNEKEYFSNVVPHSDHVCDFIQGKINGFSKASKEHSVSVVIPSTSNFVYFKSIQNLQIFSVSFYNLEGRELFTKLNDNASSMMEINLSSLTSGMYIAKIFIDEETFILKKVVVR